MCGPVVCRKMGGSDHNGGKGAPAHRGRRVVLASV
jgi:hypothetical protein